MTQEADLVFEATSFDAAVALRACQALVAAIDAGDDADCGLVGEAMSQATEAFPGLQAFVSDQGDDVDLREITINLHAISFGHPEPTLGAAVALALIGAIAEVEEVFDWCDVEECAETCRGALASISAKSPTAS